MNMSRGKRNEITRLKETRCFVPCDGYCGHHCLSKIFQVPVENMLERLLQWPRPDNPDAFNANQCGQVEFDRKEMQSKMPEIIPRRANNEKDVCCLDAHWCSGSDITVIAKLMGKRRGSFVLQFVKRMSHAPIIVLNNARVLVLTDCKTQFDDNQPTDYLITKNNVECIGHLDLGVRPMTRGG
jgi:hypothetical protein